jgi:excisionase family DNA binding protein
VDSPLDSCLTAAELAVRLRVKTDTVLRWHRAGKIPAVRISAKVLRFDLAEVLAALKAQSWARGRDHDHPPEIRPSVGTWRERTPPQAASPDRSSASPPTSSDQMSHCVTLVGFAEIVGLGEKTMRRLLAANLLPPADLIVGGNQRRWTRQTVEAWLRTKPRLPGRGGKARR